MSNSYADIVLPVVAGRLGSIFTYGCEGGIERGQMVRVGLGKRQLMGVVWRTHEVCPPFAVRGIDEVLEGTIEEGQLRFWEWLAEYYMCGMGDVMAAAMPANALEPRKRGKVFSGELPDLPTDLPVLSEAQQRAFDEIGDGVTLLHGVTGSGKTEIYIRLIAEELAKGKNVLYLVPEIAMSGQLAQRVRAWFGERVVVFHSKMTPRRRADAWQRVRKAGGGTVVLGARSAVLLPLENVGLVVVDEEHDRSYKQEEPAPRYHARDAAIVLARGMGARVVLGSATPSLESWLNAQKGKYHLVELKERYGESELPRVVVSDTLKAVQRGERTTHFNKALLDRIATMLGEGRQTMLFQNRRGYAPYIECGVCGAAVMCGQCNVAMTWHKADGTLRCHYCGRTTHVPLVCPTCGAAKLEPKGFGTEKIEQELERLFPEARVARLDRDVAGHEKIIEAFRNGEIDILVGTQMITKGFDFGGVGLVGVLNADNLLVYPDFRAAERAFQTLTQIAGRGGRRNYRAEVVIQTVQPLSPIIRQVAEGDYSGMAGEQLAQRGEFLYPPYCRLIEITLTGRDEAELWAAGNALALAGREHFGQMLLGPQPAAVDKVRWEFILTLLLKIPRDLKSAREKLRLVLDAAPKGIRALCNVDPA